MTEFYASYDALMPRLCPEYRANLERACSLIPATASHLLEFGSGTGNFTHRALAVHPHLRITGVERQQPLIDLARQKERSGRATFVQGDLRVVPLNDYDGVVSALTLHHLEKQEKYALYHRILTACAFFVNYDRVLLPGTADLRIQTEHLAFMRQQGIAEALVQHAKNEMDAHDKPLLLEEELLPFYEAGWEVVLAHLAQGFAVYRAMRA